MFRLDEDRVIDATLSGGLARYINHRFVFCFTL
jgi:SET domain-containing protein